MTVATSFVHQPSIEFDSRKVDAIFATVDQCQLPGAAVGIAIRGVPVYRKGFGLASAELPVVLTPATRMRIGSTTKHFACFAYMLLCEDGKAAINDPIGKYIPELHPIARNVTLRQLMGNTSGLRDVHDITWQLNGRGNRVTSEEILSLYCALDDVNAAPQSTWIYCNGGFLLLSVAIERITGKPLESVLWDRIFEPVGMYDSLLRRWDTDFVPNSATLHMTNQEGGFERRYLGTALAGEGGAVSTVNDMLRWLAHMSSPEVGNATTWAKMKEPQTLANGASTGYGMGLFTGRYRGLDIIHHPGGVMGGNAQMLKVPAAGLDITVLVNRHDVSALLLTNKIIDACVTGLAPLEDANSQSLLVGVYHSPSTGRVVQLFEKDGEQYASVDGLDMLLKPDHKGSLWPAGVYAYLDQPITPLGDARNPSRIGLRHFGTKDELEAVPAPSKADAHAVIGRYVSSTTGTVLTVAEAAGGPQMTSTGPFGTVVYRLECLAGSIWRVRSRSPTPRDGVIILDRERGQLRFRSDRVWSLTFHRAA